MEYPTKDVAGLVDEIRGLIEQRCGGDAEKCVSVASGVLTSLVGEAARYQIQLEAENRLLKQQLGMSGEMALRLRETVSAGRPGNGGSPAPQKKRPITNGRGLKVPDVPPKKYDTLPSLEDHGPIVDKLLLHVTKGGSTRLQTAFFLSHYQREASDIAGILDLQMKIRGYRCWYDQEAQHITQAGMLHGILTSSVFVLILTKGIFTRPWCLFEIRSALRLKKPMQLLHESCDDRPGYATLEDLVKSAPDDLKCLFHEFESLPYRRKAYEQCALLDNVLQLHAASLDALKRDVEQGGGQNKVLPLQMLTDAAAARVVYDTKQTATVFVDLGTGQVAIKILALSKDGSLDYVDILTLDLNLLSRPAEGTPESRAMEAKLHEAGASVLKHLDTFYPEEKSMERLTGVRCGATSWYRELDAQQREAVAEPAVKWLSKHFMRPLPNVAFDFEELSGIEEAALEWASVKVAMQFAFADEPCDASLSGGKGSVQCSADGGGGHGAMHLSARIALGDGASLIKADPNKGLDDWYAKVQDFALPFGKLRDLVAKDFGVRSGTRPLRMICFSGFFYLAVAAKVVDRKDAPKYLDYATAVRPKVLALVQSVAASPMDRSNGVRYLRCLDFILNDDSRHVQILFAREWAVRKKPYRVTWSTGAFIQQISEQYLTETAKGTALVKRDANAYKREPDTA
ncbi:hypothetical protein M885DRAFT_613671 [Pelagophyceae sp. CCMP2097]|nr:hypothetical protein M885DRAFT_613671 [Pelagophyceae sp. CCMP2097]|mmetsp:Transcript_32810/g.110592  ORF Transcript_32810/g.110592 Transcript_32810/m.110592 type:complete len:685 (+) Transcript_32810:124-2178(+)